ncbi:MAG: hypothetical protein LBS54_02295 [Dysgonamonadaceae bacterium]|jgi:hypothetical protein|nr:hypothetical protein [Dysgonamonadaceae bacterium]
MATKPRNYDYIPHSFLELAMWLVNFIDVVAERRKRFGITLKAFETLRIIVADFHISNQIAERENAGKTDRLDRRLKAAAAQKATRNFVNQYIRFNPNVTDDDKSDMGLTVPKKTLTPSPVAKTFPWLKVLTKLIRHLIIEYGESETKRAKPEGQHTLELVYVIANEKPTDIAQLTVVKLDTNPPLDLTFTEEDRGKRVWFAARWINTRGIKGPWTEIYFAIIP